MKLNKKYKEILRLDKLLAEAEIPHELDRNEDGWQVCYPNKKRKISDAVEFTGSYGCKEDKLEIMGLLTAEEQKSDDVIGYLSAEEVCERWKAHYFHEPRERYINCAVCGKVIPEGYIAYCRQGETQICCSLSCFGILNYPQEIIINDQTAEDKCFELRD